MGNEIIIRRRLKYLSVVALVCVFINYVRVPWMLFLGLVLPFLLFVLYIFGVFKSWNRTNFIREVVFLFAGATFWRVFLFFYNDIYSKFSSVGLLLILAFIVLTFIGSMVFPARKIFKFVVIFVIIASLFEIYFLTIVFKVVAQTRAGPVFFFGIIANVLFLISLFLLGKNLDVLEARAFFEKKKTALEKLEKMDAEQALIYLKDKLDSGMLSSEEYEKLRAEIICKL